jgi:hypothetical protein
MTVRLAIRTVVVAMMLVCLSSPTQAYLKLGTSFGPDAISLKWRAGTISYFVNAARIPSNLSSADFQAAVVRGFNTWNDVPTATVDFQFAGFVNNTPFDEDDVNTIGFLQRPELERVLASTGFTYDTRTGELIEADIFFNGSFDWSTSQGGQSGRFDIQSIAAHEAGHFLGLGHSALGETEQRSSGGRRLIAAGAIMFPIAFSPGSIVGRTLRADDVAGVSDIYPTTDFRRDTGSIQGRITKSGQGVFGAHVVAFNLSTQDLVANFTLEQDGEFVIAGLSPGLYVVRAEPLDDGDLESFFDGVQPTDLDFTPHFHERVVAVPEGGTSHRVDIAVGTR